MELTSNEISTVVYSLIRTVITESAEAAAYAKLAAQGNEDAVSLIESGNKRISEIHALLAKLSGH